MTPEQVLQQVLERLETSEGTIEMSSRELLWEYTKALRDHNKEDAP